MESFLKSTVASAQIVAIVSGTTLIEYKLLFQSNK